jgi:hypothetical protein
MHPANHISIPPVSKPRARLSEHQVITIFQAKTTTWTATELASVYGVSEKAVRDIWTGRTWSNETWHLDTSRPLQVKTVGRPRGCKDRRPRKKRASNHDPLSMSRALPSVLCRPQTEWDGVAEGSFTQDTVLMSLNQQASRGALLTQSAASSECFQESEAWNRSTAMLTLCYASVDEQLHEWDRFWRGSSSTDPFCGDYAPF